MADWNQFEDFETGETSRPAACSVCEAMLPDAVDGALTAAEQRAFDQHVAGCVQCAKELEEAQRGAAWLSMLKSQAPEPPADLLAKILAGTTGVAGAAAASVFATPSHVPEAGHGAPGFVATPTWGERVVALRARVMDVFSIENTRMTFQPRLAMTAAMAFFSIALTLNLTGVRLTDIRASNFTPGGVRRSVMDASASAARSFQNMRVVYQVESRVSELRNDGVFSNQQDEPGGAFRGPEGGTANGDAKSKSSDAAPQDSQPANGGTDSQDGKQQDSKPKGSSELVMPFPERNAQGASAGLRKDL